MMVSMADVTVEEILFIIQNLTNPAVFFTLIIFVTGYAACKLELDAGRNRRGIDRYLAAFGIGLGMQSLPLLVSIIVAALSTFSGANFNGVLTFMLLMTSIINLFMLLNAKMEAKASILASYKLVCRTFWNLVGLSILFVYIPLVIIFLYPSYLSRVFLTGWLTASGLVLYLTLVVSLIFFLLNRWFILRGTEKKPLEPFGRIRVSKTSRVLQLASKIRRNYMPAIILILTIVALVALDTTYPVFTPKIAQQTNEDHYYNHYSYPYPYDYVLVLSPDQNGKLVQHLYSLYKSTVEVQSPWLPFPQTCVLYDNPAGSAYLETPSSIQTNVWLTPNYLNEAYSNSTNLTPLGNQTNTTGIQQCKTGDVNFYFWKEVNVSSVQTLDNCTHHDYLRTDYVVIENSDKLRLYIGLIGVRYVSIPYNATTHISMIENGKNITNSPGTNIDRVSDNLVWIGPYIIQGDSPTANPFNAEEYAITLAYNSTYDTGCYPV